MSTELDNMTDETLHSMETKIELLQETLEFEKAKNEFLLHYMGERRPSYDVIDQGARLIQAELKDVVATESRPPVIETELD